MTQVGNVYGEALYDLAKAENLTETVLSQITVLNGCFQQDPDFLRLLASANLSKEERCGILDRSFGTHVHPYVLNFLKILTEKGYARYFGECCQAYRDHYNADNGILPVTAVTAVALSVDQTRRLTAKLSSLTGKTVELSNRVEPGILGGVRLDYDGKRVDDTVAHRLDAIRGLLKNTVL